MSAHGMPGQRGSTGKPTKPTWSRSGCTSRSLSARDSSSIAGISPDRRLSEIPIGESPAFCSVSLHSALTLCRLTIMGKRDRDVRMSLQTLRVLDACLENPTDELAGADVQKRSGLASGTLYPILLRLESAGWFISRWESIDPPAPGGP